MKQWSFHLQIFFLGHRAEQYLELANAPKSAIADRSIYEDAYIFARALHHLGNLSERDYLAYRRVFDSTWSPITCRRPDLLIYLKAPVSVLVERIQPRAARSRAASPPTTWPCWNRSTMNGCRYFRTLPGADHSLRRPGLRPQAAPPGYRGQRIQDKLAGREELIFPPNNT